MASSARVRMIPGITSGRRRLMKHTRATRERASVGAAIVLLALIPASDGHAADTGFFSDPPAAYVRAGSAIDYEVSSSSEPLGPRHAWFERSTGPNFAGKTKVDAVATLNGKKGFRVFASVQSLSEFDY